jgi:shikimate dehydrogenase
MLSGGSLRSGRAAVLGSPIGHSLSPVLHRAAYEALGLDWSYEAVEVKEPELAGFLGSLDGSWRGLSLTMPLKRQAARLADEVSDRVARSGAANTLVLRAGRRSAHNTDIPGAAAALRERYDGRLDRVVVLGGGATATSILYAAADLGCPAATLVVRSRERAAETVAAVARHPRAPVVDVVLVGEPVPSADLVVSTVPASVQTDDLLGVADSAGVVFEVVYDPWPTPVARRALDHGQVLVAGLDLLVHQAALQVTLMTGADAPLERMRAAGAAALRERALP